MRTAGYAYTRGLCVQQGVRTAVYTCRVGYAYSGYAYSAGTPSHPMRSGAVIRCCDQVLRSSGAVKFCGHLSCEGGGSDTQRALRLLRLTPCCSKKGMFLARDHFSLACASVAQRPVVSLDAKSVASGAWPLMPVLHAGDCFMAGTSYFVELWSYLLAGNILLVGQIYYRGTQNKNAQASPTDS